MYIYACIHPKHSGLILITFNNSCCKKFMIQNYIKTTVRNITRDKFYTALNIFGLAVGIASSILILLYINNELSYDDYHPKYERIYRIGSHFSVAGKHDSVATAGFPLGPKLKRQIPEVENFVRFLSIGENLFKHKDREFYEDKIFLIDSSFADFFSYNVIYGELGNALSKPNSIIITRDMAKRYFGNENPVGKVLSSGTNHHYVVMAVIENVPDNSHIQFEGLISLSTISDWVAGESIWSFNCFTYILLEKGAHISQVKAKFDDFYDKNMAQVGKQLNATYEIIPQRIDRIHLHSDLDWDLATGDVEYIYIFSLIGIFLLLIASINYMNMATARSERRAKETGVRKVVGATRSMLIQQFFTESLVMSFIALLIALGLIEIILPYFNAVAEKNMDFSIMTQPEIISGTLAMTLFVGIVSGSYPAFYLSKFSPARVIRGRIRTGKEGGFLRKVLVVFQFAISFSMIIGTIIVQQQLNFFQQRNIGIETNNILVSPVRDTTLLNHLATFKSELKKQSKIKGIATSSSTLPATRTSRNAHFVEIEGKMKEFALNFIMVDYEYIDLLDIKILKGRNFSPDSSLDRQHAFIINKSAAQRFGWSLDEALGKKMQFGIKIDEESNPRQGKVIGVVDNFNYTSLHHRVEPIVILLSEQALPVMNIKVEPGNMEDIIAEIEQLREEFKVSTPMNYLFLDQRIDSFYQTERKLNKLFGYFSILCILISCLGLVGLISYVAEQRTKEIGVRKVMGASFSSIIILMTKDFLLLVFIAAIIAFPAIYFAMNRWLESFAYSITIKWYVFPLGALISLIIAFAAVSWQAIKTAKTNPVESLRYE